MYILSDMFYGKIDPASRMVRRGSEYERLSWRYVELDEAVRQTLSEEHRSFCDEMEELRARMTNISEEDCFIRGFRMGVQVMLDVIFEYRSQLPQI